MPFDRVNAGLAVKPDWFLASPTDKVPLLRAHQPGGADAVLFESMVICEYLEHGPPRCTRAMRRPALDPCTLA